MASSLEELLAKEGYRGRRSGRTSRASFGAEPTHQRTESDSSQMPRDHLFSTQKHRLSFGNQTEITEENHTRLGGLNSDGQNPSHRNKSSSFSKKKTHVSSSKSLKYFEGGEGQRQKSKNWTPELALDEVAIKAVVSILNDYISHFVKDNEFRITLRQNCFSCLKVNEENNTRVMANLEQAIETLEKAASEDVSSRKDLKSTSMRLSMITSLNSSNSVSACAHLYLSVAYMLRKKDKVSAKYLVQVFCDCPYLARVHLLPDLWSCLLFPHLSHLEDWYHQQVLSLINSAERMTKLELLDKFYSEILDSGTYQIALYYKDWLAQGTRAPSLPCIELPTVSLRDHSSEFSSPRPVVSKKLYQSVFGNSSTREIEEVIADNGEVCEGSAVEVTKTLTYSEITKYEKDIGKSWREDTLENFYNLSTSQEECKSIDGSSPPNMDIKDHFSNFEEHHFDLFSSFSGKKSYELILMKLAESVFESSQTGDLTIPVISQTNKLLQIEATDSSQLGAPEEFICSLWGKLFDDPVTLETGQTFERAAIDDWFKHGNQTCPVTGKLLNCQTVPFTNFVLKRVIDTWKSERCSHLIALAAKILKNESSEADETAVSILKLLLTSFGKEQRLANAKHLVSLGGLEFLVRRFALGNSEEKTQIAALLLCFIEADASCRNQIKRNIERHSLFELLQSKQQKSQRNAVLLLFQLICPCSKKEAKLFLSGLKNEEITNAKHVLLMYLKMSPLEEKPWVAALILHLDLLVEPQPHKYSMYREKAVDAIALALNLSLTHENIQESCCRVLVVLLWPLKEATTINKYEVKPGEDEEETMKEWRRNLWTSVVSDEKRSFLEAISKWLESRNSTLVKASLITIAWLSCEICSINDAKMHLSVFSVLVSGLKDIVRSSDQIEHKVLASMSLLNFTYIPG